MQLKKVFFILLLVFSIAGFSQVPELSPLSKISVLTSGSGDILYTAFGHSAIRVQDPTMGIDVVYNYGIFDTSGENFYLKFSQGRMDYKLERQPFDYYLRGYEIQNRWVAEQSLNLSVQQKNRLFQYLENNNLPENKVYAYDYFSNNCATKIWDVLAVNLGDKLVFDETYINERFTFRELIHHNIAINSWGAFGIDLALGSVIDRKASPKEHLYLPIYVMNQLKVAKLRGLPVANKEISLYESAPREIKNNFLTSPLFFSILISLIILTITYFDYQKGTRTKVLDFGIFLITGLAGLIMCFLWFFTDHIWTVGNYNILWAFPLSSIVSFFMLRKKLVFWVRNYILALLSLFAVLLFFWVLRIQSFTFVLIPLLIALAIRYGYLWYFSKKIKTSQK